METAESFKIISVTGAHSSVGKTTLCSILLENLKGFGAIKFTRTPLFTSVVDDDNILRETGKDTAIYLESGAEKVVWIQSPGGEELEDALDIAFAKMEGIKGLIVEGNSPSSLINPNVIIFIIGEDGQLKPPAAAIACHADILVINSPKLRDVPQVLLPILKKNTNVFSIDLLNKKGEIDKLLVYIKKYIAF